MGRALLICLVALLFAAPSASAATAALVSGMTENPPGSYAYVTYYAAAGESNRVAFVAVGAGTRITDDGASIEAGPGCDQISAHEVFCHARGLEAGLGDGDDTLSGPSGRVTGGDGNDTIHAGGYVEGGAGDDSLTGRGGDDNLEGNGGRDLLRGAGGDDRLTDGDSAATGVDSDVLDGGAGSDTVAYVHRRGPLVVDLLSGRGGEGGEKDTLIDVENAFDDVSSRPTVATGNARANDLSLFADRSVARGLGGDDYLTATSSYRDVVDAGPGDDILALTPYTGAVPDEIACGSGRDTVYFSQPPAQYVPADCEWVRSDL